MSVAQTKWLVFCAAVTFAAGYLVGDARHERPTRAAIADRPAADSLAASGVPNWSAGFSIRRGTAESLVIDPHSVHVSNERAFLRPPVHPDSPVYVVAFDDGRILIAGTAPQPKTVPDHERHPLFARDEKAADAEPEPRR